MKPLLCVSVKRMVHYTFALIIVYSTKKQSLTGIPYPGSNI